MNSKKMGLFAAAALTVMAAQANANTSKTVAAKEAGVCMNSCKGKHGAAECGGKVKVQEAGKDITTPEACAKAVDAKWVKAEKTK